MNKLFLLGMSVFTLVFTVHLNAQKQVLDHTVYDNWQSIKETVIQAQGQFVAYTVLPQEGDGILYLKQLNNKWQLVIPRGAQPVFSQDGNFLVCKIKPFFGETRKAKIDKKKAYELPKDSLFIFDLVNKKSQLIASVKSFQLPEKGNGVIAYLMDKKGDINKEGTTLVFQNLSDTLKHNFKQVAQYAMQPTGANVLIYQVNTKEHPAQVSLVKLSDTTPKILSSQLFSATGLDWDEQGNQAVYYVELDSTSKALQKNYAVAYYKNGMDTAIRVVNRQDKNLPTGYVIGGDRKLNFSKSGKVLELGIQPILPIKDTSLPEFERVSIDIWHYADENLQPMQLKNLEASLKSTETILYRPQENLLTYLGKISENNIKLTGEGDGDWAYATIDSVHAEATQWQGYSLKDIYAINTKSGQKKLVTSNWKGQLISASYNGAKLLYFDEPHKCYYVYDVQTNQKQIIAKDIKHALSDEENDMPDDPNAYGIAKWMDNNEQVIIYDRYDLWLVDVNGKTPSKRLSNGRFSKTEYRFVETDPTIKVFNNNSILMIKGYNEVDKTESIGNLVLNTSQLFINNQLPMHFTTVSAAKKSTDFVMLQENEKMSPNLFAYTRNNIAQNPTAISSLNPQQSNYNWLTSEIVKWKSYTGKLTEGVLYKPQDFDSHKKYPMIVYFYERNNQTLHNYLAPTPTGSRLNIPFFVSRGYLVFVPDIWYKKGYPGQGAYDYIVSGTKALIQKGFVDSTKIGLQGQSWGGYQIAYLITKTNMFAAAWAGAPVVNMTSAYGGIRWGSGMNRQFQYEKTQSRIGATLWERPDLYLKNSPLFSLPKVTTPVVIMSNDADDAVPWYQGIEMFTAMKRLHKKAWLLVYNNEFHNLVERRNKKDIQIREQQFFDYYLKNELMPKWMSEGVPAKMKGRTLGLGY